MKYTSKSQIKMIVLDTMIMRFIEQLEHLQNTIPTMITMNAMMADKVLMLADFRVSFKEIPIMAPSVRNNDMPLIMDINIERLELSHQEYMP